MRRRSARSQTTLAGSPGVAGPVGCSSEARSTQGSTSTTVTRWWRQRLPSVARRLGPPMVGQSRRRRIPGSSRWSAPGGVGRNRSRSSAPGSPPRCAWVASCRVRAAPSIPCSRAWSASRRASTRQTECRRRGSAARPPARLRAMVGAPAPADPVTATSRPLHVPSAGSRDRWRSSRSMRSIGRARRASSVASSSSGSPGAMTAVAPSPVQRSTSPPTTKTGQPATAARLMSSRSRPTVRWSTSKAENGRPESSRLSRSGIPAQGRNSWPLPRSARRRSTAGIQAGAPEARPRRT